MRELSAEEKAKAYDKVREKIDLRFGSNVAEEIFSQFEESEDERIRKTLIEFFGRTAKYNCSTAGISDKDILVWLEKQGEKSVDKIEPKFKVGDWVVSPNGVYWRIDKISNNRYEVTSNTGESSSWNLDTNIYHRFFIQDAKDGDVLISRYGNPLIYNGNYNSLNIGAYCGITCDDNKFKVAEEKCHWTENVDIKPSTKEQRDLLFTKMKEAGYEWDAEKKELKKIEQKPADKAEPNYPIVDFKAKDWYVSKVDGKIHDMTYDTADKKELKKIELAKGEDYGIDGLWHAQRILEKTFSEVEGYQSDDGILSHECAISAVKELYKQKHNTWSEED